MYKNLVALNTAERELTLSPVGDWAFAAAATIVPVGLDEAQALAGEYVLVFSNEENGPGYLAALLGTEGSNRYLNEQRQWQAQTIPARLRLYPFMLVRGATPEQFVVARDADAPHFRGAGGTPVFDDQGKAGEIVQQVTVALFKLHQSQEQASALASELEAAGLITNRRIVVRLKDGRGHVFEGFKAIDEEKLASLDEETREKLTQSGALSLLELHRQSLANFERLVP